MSDFFMRTISGILGIILLLFIVMRGGIWVNVSVLIISLIGIKELFDALKKNNIHPMKNVAYITTIGIFLTNLNDHITMGFIVMLSIVYLLLTIIFGKRTDLEDIGMTVLGIAYIPFLFNYVNYLNDTKFIWLIFTIAFGTDTFAYLIGNLFGKKKLCPDISPNKTKEGFFGGIVGSIIVSTAYAKFYEIFPLWHIIILSILASILAQFGDLVASKIKRLSKIKDFGFIMPGHGGVLDRFDSIILSCPLIYYYVKFFLI